MKSNSRNLAAVATSALIAMGAFSAASAQDVVIVGAGGGSQDAHQKAIWDPAAAALGINIGTDSHQGIAEARAQVDAGAVTWDLVSFNVGQAMELAEAGYLVKLPEGIVNADRFAPGSVNDYCIGHTVYSQIIGYNTDKWGENGPQGMKDFFDTDKFQGIRGLYRGPLGNLEGAAIALGVAQADVYDYLSTDEGLDAAFARVKEMIENSEVIWWDSGAQLTQLHVDEEIDLSYGWDGRIVAAKEAGAPVQPVYQDGILAADCYGLLKNSPNPERAIEYLTEISKAEYTKDLVLYFPYGSANLDAYNDYDADTLARLTSSPDNVSGQFPQGFAFWGANNARLGERFDEMLLLMNQ